MSKTAPTPFPDTSPTAMPHRPTCNPNWGRPDLQAALRVQPSSFEDVVRSLQLLPYQYVDSARLKDWLPKNKDHKYVPSALLKAWVWRLTAISEEGCTDPILYRVMMASSSR